MLPDTVPKTTFQARVRETFKSSRKICTGLKEQAQVRWTSRRDELPGYSDPARFNHCALDEMDMQPIGSS